MAWQLKEQEFGAGIWCQFSSFAEGKSRLDISLESHLRRQKELGLHVLPSYPKLPFRCMWPL
jgi:hypothetical protein